eukprot:6927498-Pyramimonas_sp.AAC.1
MHHKTAAIAPFQPRHKGFKFLPEEFGKVRHPVSQIVHDRMQDVQGARNRQTLLHQILVLEIVVVWLLRRETHAVRALG